MENSFVFYFLLLQEFINALQIIQAVVQEETELRNDAQLISHLSAQVEADSLLVGIDILQNFLTLSDGNTLR